MTHQFEPIDRDGRALAPELARLSELLAERTHERWMTARLAQGWTYGSRRDDDLKQHPCLIAFTDLPESEKQLDRTTARGILEDLLAMGYTIRPPGD